MSFIEKMVEKAIIYLGKDDNKKKIQMFVLDPLLNHIIERLFPYFILITVLFAILSILIIITFTFIIWKNTAIPIATNIII
jgi:hypothetical protein